MKERMGCWAVGCLTIVAILIAAAVAVFFFAKKVSREVAEVQKIELEPVEFTQTEAVDVLDRINQFRARLATGEGPDAIELSEREINIAIAANPKWSQAKDFVRVDLEPGQIGFKFKVPFDPQLFQIDTSRAPFMEKIIGSLKGVSIGGTATLKAEIDGEKIDLRVDDLKLPGVPFADMLVQQARSRNLADHISQRDREQLKRIKSFKVEQDLVVAEAQ
jgi:hypothetical protein